MLILGIGVVVTGIVNAWICVRIGVGIEFPGSAFKLNDFQYILKRLSLMMVMLLGEI